MPTTTDAVYEALKAFQDQDVNGNGQKDEAFLTVDLLQMLRSGLDLVLERRSSIIRKIIKWNLPGIRNM